VSADLLLIALRTLALIGLFQASGVVFFLRLFGAWLPVSEVRIRRLGAAAAVGAVALVMAHRELEVVRMGDGLSALFELRLQRLAWRDGAGLAGELEVLGLIAIACSLLRRGAPASILAICGAVAATVAAVATGHTSVHPQRLLLTPLLALHLLLVAFWLGSLWPLILCGRHERRATVLTVLSGFSGLAGVLVPCLGLAGLSMALILLPSPAAWHGTYAALLLTKLSIFVLLLLIASWNRWRALPAIAHTPGPGALRALQRSIVFEYALMAAVLAVTATMTTLYSP
jgi:putative copper export protein